MHSSTRTVEQSIGTIVDRIVVVNNDGSTAVGLVFDAGMGRSVAISDYSKSTSVGNQPLETQHWI